MSNQGSDLIRPGARPHCMPGMLSRELPHVRLEEGEPLRDWSLRLERPAPRTAWEYCPACCSVCERLLSSFKACAVAGWCGLEHSSVPQLLRLPVVAAG